MERLYEAYLRGDGNLPTEWTRYFDGLKDRDSDKLSSVAERPFPVRSVFNPVGGNATGTGPRGGRPGVADGRQQVAGLQERLDQLIRNYRVRGHIVAAVDPLGNRPLPPAELDPGF